MKQKLLTLTILLMGISPNVFAYDFSGLAPTGQTLYFNIVNGGAQVTYPGSSGGYWTGYTMPTGNLIIPDSVSHGGHSFAVTSIDSYAFINCNGLTSVTIPAPVTAIGDSSFSN